MRDVIAGSIADAARGFYERGWVLGTSGNFSGLVSDDPFRVCITASGREKGRLKEEDFLVVDENGSAVEGEGQPSAETRIHISLYRRIPGCGAVFHTHSVWGTLLADRSLSDGAISIEGYEMLKGLSGVSTHEHRESVPVIENSQDYDLLASQIDGIVEGSPGIHGIYLRRHGLYTWGETVADAKRHIEIFEFLFEAVGRGIS